jgi:integrating conjugative element membrane protein (TIGR03747 family)
MPSKSTSMLETNYWTVVKRPFQTIASIGLTFFGAALLCMAVCIAYLIVWKEISNPEEVMIEAISHAWALTMWQDHTTHISQLAATLAAFVYWLFFKLTLIHEAMERFSQDAPTNMIDMVYRNALIVPNKTEIRVAMLSTQLFSVRLALVLGCLPLLVVAYAAGMIDGLVERYIRSVSAGRESSSLYHRAKFFQLSGGVTLLMGFICLPLPVDPRLILIPGALVIGLLARLQWKYYKKYL